MERGCQIRLHHLIEKCAEGRAVLSEADVTKVKEFASRCASIAAVYVFGSLATGRGRHGSDMDLALMLRGPLSAMDRVEMETELSNLVHRDVDLVVFHQASLLLQHQVLKYGHLIYEADSAERVRQETRARRDYLDSGFLYRKLKRKTSHVG